MSGRIRFGVYELDRDAMELRKHGVPIRLQEQPFRVLAMLAETAGRGHHPRGTARADLGKYFR